MKNIKFHLTVLSLYFLFISIYSVCSYKCDLLFGICGLQYLIYGILFPLIYVLLFVWKNDILRLTKTTRSKYFNYVIAGILYSLFLFYVILVPNKVDLRTVKYSSQSQSLYSACKANASELTELNNNPYLIHEYCDFRAHLMADRTNEKLISLKNYNKIERKTAKDAFLYVNQYAIRVVGKLSWELGESCQKTHSRTFCNCYSSLLTMKIQNACKGCSEERLKEYVDKFASGAIEGCRFYR